MKIAVVDKHPLFRRGLILVLHKHFRDFTAAEADSLTNLRDSVPGFSADIVIIGLDQMAAKRHLEMIRLVKKNWPGGSVVIMDYALNPIQILRYLREGVMGCLAKDSSIEELIDCVTLVWKGKRYISTEALIWMLRQPNRLSFAEHGTARNQRILTARQLEVAEYVAGGMPIKWIAGALKRKESTVSTIKSIVFRKLGVSNPAQLRGALYASSTDQLILD